MQSGVIFRSTAARGRVLGVSLSSHYQSFSTRFSLTDVSLADFALTEAAYVVVRLLQRFPEIGLPENEVVELTGVEKQSITLVLASAEGCKVSLY